MLERIEDMPAGTLGFRGEGELTEEDFKTVLAPPLHEAAAAGDVRLLLITPPDFGMSDVQAVAERFQSGELGAGLGHRADWGRVAIVTESSWLRRSAKVWKRMIPVTVEVFAGDEEAAAREWLLQG